MRTTIMFILNGFTITSIIELSDWKQAIPCKHRQVTHTHTHTQITHCTPVPSVAFPNTNTGDTHTDTHSLSAAVHTNCMDVNIKRSHCVVFSPDSCVLISI